MSDENTPQDAPAEAQEAPAQEIDWKAEARKWEDRSKANHAELEQARSALNAAQEAARLAQEAAQVQEARAKQASTLRAKEHLLAAAGLPMDLADSLTGEDEDGWKSRIQLFASLRTPPERTPNPAQSEPNATPSNDEVARNFFGL